MTAQRLLSADRHNTALTTAIRLPLTLNIRATTKRPETHREGYVTILPQPQVLFLSAWAFPKHAHNRDSLQIPNDDTHVHGARCILHSIYCGILTLRDGIKRASRRQ